MEDFRPQRPGVQRPGMQQAHEPAPTRHKTRWHATEITFGPAVKVALTVPPWVLGIAMAAHIPPPPDGAFTAFYTVLVLVGAAWWSKRVWASGERVDR